MNGEHITRIVVVIVLIAAGLGIYAWWLYNAIMRMKHNASNALAQITVQLTRRYDLIPNLAKAVRGYIKHEHATLQDVIEARNQSRVTLSNAKVDNPSSIAAVQQAEGVFTSALSRLLVVMEQYPQLKADRQVTGLTDELRTTENRIAFARQSYNDAVTEFNFGQDAFPAHLFARRWSFAHLPLLEVTEERMKEIQRPPDIDIDVL